MITFSAQPPDFNGYLDEIESIGPNDLSLDAHQPSYGDFPIDEYCQRYARLIALMCRESIDAVMVTQEENVRYFTGYLSVLWTSKFRPFVGLLPANSDRGATLILPTQERGNAEVSSWVKSLTIYPAQDSPIPYIAGAIRERGLAKGKIGLELGFGQRLGMTQEQLHQLVQALPDVEFVNGTPILQAVRMLKSPAEVDRLTKACELSESAVEAGWRILRPGVTERDILATMASTMYAAGAEVGTKPSFFGILAGERWPLANAVASDYTIKPGDFVLVDGGATYRGYAADFIRQASLGPPTTSQQQWFDAIVEANEATIKAVGPGVHAYEVYDTALSALRRCGLAEWNRMNIVGHGIGMEIHELPWLGQRGVVYSSETRLRAGMVLCIEPGVTAPQGTGPAGHFIVEDVVAVTNNGVQVLTHRLPKTLWVVKWE